ncbi:uncharacterized protein TNCV_4139161 [Trichonephila clavipes]|nr:uncharacterized protein TNCV_4139161 [Trichonephila clavipes]
MTLSGSLPQINHGVQGETQGRYHMSLALELSIPPTTGEDMRLDGYLEYPHAAKALYTYKHLCLLRNSNPVPTAAQSASLTTIPVGRHLSILCMTNNLQHCH